MTDSSERAIQHEVRGEKGKQCEYGTCENESTTLIQFDETKPVQRIWFCPGHSGYSVKEHADAHKIEVSG